jgi:hypothetical protein
MLEHGNDLGRTKRYARDVPAYGLCFIFGSARSGTTWLQFLLAALPGAITVRETHLVPDYLVPLWEKWQLQRNSSSPDGLPHVISNHQFKAAVRAFARSILNSIHSNHPDARLVVEKTPRHVYNLDMLHTVFLRARLLHMLRDPRAVIASQLATRKEPWSFIPKNSTVETLAAEWMQRAKAARSAQQKYTELFMTVRYENLQEDLQFELGRLCRFLKLDDVLPSLPEIAERARGWTAAHLAERAAAGALPAAFQEKRDRFYRQGEAFGWKQELSADQVLTIEQICGRQMAEWGYSI